MSKEKFFPEIISRLPEVNMPVKGSMGYAFQGQEQQLIFMSYDEETIVPEHSHEAQWGVVLDGEIEMTIDGETKKFTKGDTYFIPQGTKHRATVYKGYKAVTLFDQKNRYKLK